MKKRLIAAVAILTLGLFASAGLADTKKGEKIDGKKEFEEHCAVCHKDGGNMITPAKTLSKKDRAGQRGEERQGYRKTDAQTRTGDDRIRQQDHLRQGSKGDCRLYPEDVQIEMIRIKRIYDPPAPEDGRRVLVDRLWPRGVAKEAAHIDDWLKEIAPSDELRKWFGHDPARWEEFRQRYRQELQGHSELLERLRQGSAAGERYSPLRGKGYGA